LEQLRVAFGVLKQGKFNYLKLAVRFINSMLRGDSTLIMRKKITFLSLIFSLGLLMACSEEKGAKDTGAVNPTTATTPVAPANVNYGAGIFDLEKGPEGSWRWVGEQGTVRLKNNSTDMRLKIAGSAPIDLINQPNQVTIKLNGEQLEQLTLTKEKNTFDKDFSIPASKQAGSEFSELTISSSKSFVPKQVYKNSSDDRKLSLSLTKLEWEPKQ
jgi:hypothetical protein